VPQADRPIGYWLKALDRLIDARLAEALAGAGLNRRQWQLLNVLGRAPSTEEELGAAVAPFLEPPLPPAGPARLEPAGGPRPVDDVLAQLAPLVASGDVQHQTGGPYALTEPGRSRLAQVRAAVDRTRGQRRHPAADGGQPGGCGLTAGTDLARSFPRCRRRPDTRSGAPVLSAALAARSSA
jgi:hypothetical protein